jgi:hypothetical protein
MPDHENQSDAASGEVRSPEQLRADIARTRAAITEDVAALGNKLKPEHIKENAKEFLQHASSAAREGAKDIARDVKDAALDSLRSAKDHAVEAVADRMYEVGSRARAASHSVSVYAADNAVPLTLLGVGLGWLLLSLRRQHRLRAALES